MNFRNIYNSLFILFIIMIVSYKANLFGEIPLYHLFKNIQKNMATLVEKKIFFFLTF